MFKWQQIKMATQKNTPKIKDLSSEDLLECLRIGYVLKKAIETNDLSKQKELENSAPKLLMLLEYLILNLDNPNIDTSLIPTIERFLGISLKKEKEEAQELEEEKEDELSKEEKSRRLRLAVYEIYKILNPNRLAGETHIENFINNVITRGMKVAMEYEGKEFAKHFSKEDLKNVESYKPSFVEALNKEGHKGFGRGI